MDYVACLQSWAKTAFMAEIFVEQIFAELIFAILAIICENKFREAYKISNNRENLSGKIWWSLNKKTDFIKPSINKKNE